MNICADETGVRHRSMTRVIQDAREPTTPALTGMIDGTDAKFAFGVVIYKKLTLRLRSRLCTPEAGVKTPAVGKRIVAVCNPYLILIAVPGSASQNLEGAY